MRRKRLVQDRKGFFSTEMVIVIAVTMLIASALTEVISTGIRYYKKFVALQEMRRIAEGIKKYYEENAFLVNSRRIDSLYSDVLPDGSPSVRLPLPDGSFLVPEIDYDRSSNPSGLRYFSTNPFDEGGTNFRIYISPLKEDPAGRYAYRDIWIIDTKGRRHRMLSKIVNGEIQCDPSEVCYRVSGRDITEDLYEKTIQQVEKIAAKLSDYTGSRYAADPRKSTLKYYFANTDTNGYSDAHCTGGPGCYFASASEIPNTYRVTHYSDITEQTIDGHVTVSYSTAGLSYVPNLSLLSQIVPQLFSPEEIETPFRTRVWFDNSSPNVRNPQTLGLSNLGGYNALLVTCIDDTHCVTYRVSQ